MSLFIATRLGRGCILLTYVMQKPPFDIRMSSPPFFTFTTPSPSVLTPSLSSGSTFSTPSMHNTLTPPSPLDDLGGYGGMPWDSADMPVSFFFPLLHFLL